MLPPEFVLLAAAINMVAPAFYIFAMFHDRVSPNRVTFFLWSLAAFTAFAAQITEGVGIRAALTFGAGLGPALILLASFHQRQIPWKLGRLDYYCGALSLVGIVLWFSFGHASIAILFAILADGLAALPTAIKAWHAPHSENLTAYLLTAIAGVITLLAVKDWTVAHYAFPLYVAICCIVLAGILLLRRPKVAMQHQTM